MAKFPKFREFLEEEAGTVSGDIATTSSIMDLVKRNKHIDKGKKCHAHGKKNCVECEDLKESKKWN